MPHFPTGRTQEFVSWRVTTPKNWNGNGTLIWNRLAGRMAVENHLDVLATARLLAQLHLAMADAAIACWDSKYRYVAWRPITAIRLGDTDGNAATVADPTWSPWLAATPAHPEYLSGHSSISGAAAFVLSDAFGEHTTFWVDSDARPGTRQFSSFDEALAEVVNARVFGGIHFRTACVRGNAVGKQSRSTFSTTRRNRAAASRSTISRVSPVQPSACFAARRPV